MEVSIRKIVFTAIEKITQKHKR